MVTFKVDTADIILNDLGEGQGKIIISDGNWGYNFSYFWGSMGSNLIDFLIRINADYFAGKLGPHERGEINAKKTVSSIRKALKENFNNEYPWYVEKEFQANLRAELKDIEQEGFANTDHYFSLINSFTNNLNYYLIEDSYDRKNIEETIKSIFSEPWHYIVQDEHREVVYLTKLHKKLVKELNKIKKDNIKLEEIKSI